MATRVMEGARRERNEKRLPPSRDSCSTRKSDCLQSSGDLFYALPLYLKKDLENVEKRALSIIYPGLAYCWFSHDVTKIQTKKLSVLPRFYFHDALEQPKTNCQTNFRFKRVLGFVIEYA